MTKRYKKPFLRDVVARVDFASPVESLQKGVPADVSKLLLMAFPISEPQKAIGAELMITPEETKQQKLEQMNWFYHAKNREKKACISQNFFWVEYETYASFNALKSDFLPVLEQLFASVENLQVKRFGIRYINHIQLDEEDVFDWSQYLGESLLASLSVPHGDRPIIRGFNNLTFSDGDMILQFHYGMHNPAFPAPIKEKIYILDFDAFVQGLLDLDDIRKRIDSFHDAIASLFEQVITDSLRELMEVIDESEHERT